MTKKDITTLFTEETLTKIFPASRADDFFDALYGDASEGAYDISLAFLSHDTTKNELSFELQLHERPGKCLACNLTYGLPEVFSRHPLINMNGVAEEIGKMTGMTIREWQLGITNSVSKNLHTVPFNILLG